MTPIDLVAPLVLDEELLNMAKTLARQHFERCKGEGLEPTIGGLTLAYCPEVAKMVADRAQAANGGHLVSRLTRRQAANIGANILVRQDKDQKLSGTERIALACQAVAIAAWGHAMVEYDPFEGPTNPKWRP